MRGLTDEHDALSDVKLSLSLRINLLRTFDIEYQILLISGGKLLVWNLLARGKFEMPELIGFYDSIQLW
jgi:hypothetical protein